jgi:hypothetical protein
MLKPHRLALANTPGPRVLAFMLRIFSVAKSNSEEGEIYSYGNFVVDKRMCCKCRN